MGWTNVGLRPSNGRDLSPPKCLTASRAHQASYSMGSKGLFMGGGGGPGGKGFSPFFVCGGGWG